MDILDETEIRPMGIVRGTHRMNDVPEADVREQLASTGYDAVESTVAEEGLCDTWEKWYLCGVRHDHK